MLLDNWYPRYADLPFRTCRIGWSCNFDHYWERPTPPPEKDIDVSFIGYNSHPDRARYVDFIRRAFPHLRLHIVLETSPDTFSSFVPKSRYFDVIQRSRIALNLRGAADRGKTMRAYEIPYVGSFMLSQMIDDPGVAEDFENGTHCLYFDDDDSLEESITWALAEDGFREQIARQGHEKALGDLSVKRRWGAVVRWLEDGRRIQETL
jgi:spore maturation protein CgeB